MCFVSSYDIICIIFVPKQRGLPLCDMQISYGMLYLMSMCASLLYSFFQVVLFCKTYSGCCHVYFADPNTLRYFFNLGFQVLNGYLRIQSINLTCELVVIIIELNVNQCCAFLRWAIFGRWECLGDKQYTINKSV